MKFIIGIELKKLPKLLDKEKDKIKSFQYIEIQTR